MKEKLRLKDVDNTYQDHRDVDFRIEGRRRSPKGGRLTLAGFIGGATGFAIRSALPNEWGVKSPFYFFLFVFAGVTIGTAVGRLFSRSS